MYEINFSGDLSNLVGLHFKIWKRYFNSVYDFIAERGLVEDLRQEIVLSSLTLYRFGYKVGDKRTPALCQKALYNFLVKYGLKKDKKRGWVSKEVGIIEKDFEEIR